MRVLVVGSGGREHALVHGLARAPSVSDVLAAPGNPGMARLAECVDVRVTDLDGLAHLVEARAVDLVVVGPEQPLVDGLVDRLAACGRLAFGPSQGAARLEGSKAWMKEVLVAAGVPTARHATFRAGDEPAAERFLATLPGRYVVKTDGLAQGKGVLVTEDLAEARAAVRSYLAGEAFGDAGRTIVIEEGLTGPELSLLVVCNGDPDGARPLAPAQDYKRVGDGDRGPNTGGMGAYSPVPIADAAVVDDVMARAVLPTLHELARRGTPYRGVLYAGLMLTPGGPKILEYNVRFGDPECQVVVPRLVSDLGELCMAAATGETLPQPVFTDEAAVTVVLASEGYPASPRTGDVIEGLDDVDEPGVTIFHAGTRRRDDGALVTAGGRVLAVTALGPTIADARARAYAAADRIRWPGVVRRSDIAAR